MLGDPIETMDGFIESCWLISRFVAGACSEYDVRWIDEYESQYKHSLVNDSVPTGVEKY